MCDQCSEEKTSQPERIVRYADGTEVAVYRDDYGAEVDANGDYLLIRTRAEHQQERDYFGGRYQEYLKAYHAAVAQDDAENIAFCSALLASLRSYLTELDRLLADTDQPLPVE